VDGSTAISLPYGRESLSTSPDISLSPTVYIIPGKSIGASPYNVPAVRFTGTSDTIPDASFFGQTNVLYIYAKQEVTLYVELSGAYGGSFTVYPNGVNPNTGIAIPLEPGFEGGSPGIVYGLYTLNKNDVLKVFLGTAGEEVQNSLGVLRNNGFGQGGLGTIFGGSNGGGASYAVHFKSTNNTDEDVYDALTRSFTASSTGTLVCIAGAGGGASRNASGGSAGFSETSYASLVYGAILEHGPIGSRGGVNNIIGAAPYDAGLLVNQFSGGGGVLTTGGQSNVPDQIPYRGSFGTKLTPFSTSTGSNGGTVSTSTGSGGGGGGGGLYAGGAGGWNGLPKPNNVHGAGGGGSSWRGLLQKTTRGSQSYGNLNVYRASFGDQGRIWDTREFRLQNRNGYLVLGLRAGLNT
jgi:hypothetical protein